MRLIFVRHAQSIGNAENRLQGRAEFDLTEAGHGQAERLYTRFQNDTFQPTHIYSSPQIRTATTAQIASRSWELPIVHWDDLKEHDIGIFSGLTWDEIEQKHPETAKAYQTNRDWTAVEGAETLPQRRDRGQRVIQTLIERHNDDDVVLSFSHGGIIQYIVSALMRADRTWGIPVRNTAVFDFEIESGLWHSDGDSLLSNFNWQIHTFNDASHLE